MTKTYSRRWREPKDDSGAILLACDRKYQWMALAAVGCARRWLAPSFAVEVWTWENGDPPWDDAVLDRLYDLDANRLHLPATGQYCAGWEGRQHAMCLTKHRRVMMIDTDTYINDPLAGAFEDSPQDCCLYHEPHSCYRHPEFAAYFGLSPVEHAGGGYTNFDIHFGIYDRAKPRCADLLRATSDCLGQGPQCYGAAKVVGDQDIRNGFIHQLGVDVRASAWRTHGGGFWPIERQIASASPIVHQMGSDAKAWDEAGYMRLMELLDQSDERLRCAS